MNEKLNNINDIIYAWFPSRYKRSPEKLSKRDIMEFDFIKNDEYTKWFFDTLIWDVVYIKEIENLTSLENVVISHEKMFLSCNQENFSKINVEKKVPNKEDRLVKSLSWSRISSWNFSKKQFIKTYFEKEEFFETVEILFWKMLWTIIEYSNFSDKEKLINTCLTWFDWVISDDKRKASILSTSFDNIIKSDLPNSIAELSFDLESQFETKLMDFVDNICTMWYADNISPDLMRLKEFKTWKNPWTQEKVDTHWQLEIYCMLIKRLSWKLPQDVELIWIETQNNENGDIIPTWKIERFKYNAKEHEKDIMKWEKEIPRIFKEIQEAQIEWEEQKENENQAWVEEMLIMDLYTLVNKQEQLEEEINSLKERIKEQMMENSVEKFEMPSIGTVYFMDRKTYEYPWEICIRTDLLKKEFAEKEKEIKVMKNEFEKTVTPIISRSLVFKKSKQNDW